MAIKIRVLSISLAFSLLILVSCASAPETETGIGVPLSVTPLGTKAYEVAAQAVPSVYLVSEDEVKRSWGRQPEINPFLPQVKSITGKQFEIFPLKLIAKDDLLVTILDVKAYDDAGEVIGKSYEKDKYIDFWFARIAEEDDDWERKKRTIEKFVPYFGSAFPMYSDRSYIIVIVTSKGTKAPARYVVTLELEGAVVTVDVPGI